MTVAAFARMTVEDSRKILPPKFYPPWVVFTQRQKLIIHLIVYIISYIHTFIAFHILIMRALILFLYEMQLDWLNAELEKLWPYVDEVLLFHFFVLRNLIRSSGC